MQAILESTLLILDVLVPIEIARGEFDYVYNKKHHLMVAFYISLNQLLTYNPSCYKMWLLKI